MYVKHCKLRKNKQLELMKYFVAGTTARTADNFRSYNALDVSEFKHYRINNSKLFANKHNHINGIENFWNQAKRHMRKFNGIPKESFELFLKECEWRFNIGAPSKLLVDLKSLLKESY